MFRSLRCVVHGKVQGVGFRFWVHRHGAGLGLSGWVRNLRDGTVEVLAQGDDSKLDDLKKAVRQGPPMSRVHDLECELVDHEKEYEGFSIV